MKDRFKTAVLPGALALCTTLFACASRAPSGQPAPADTSAAITATSGNVCDPFCQSQGGPFYLRLSFGTDEASCTQRGGDWYTADQGYPGPPPGCCCKCTRPGFCL